MKDGLSLARKEATYSISFGSPTLPVGISLPNNSILYSTSPVIEVITIRVLIVPGFIALILILLLM
mgnify:FL=1|tara:strand:- start:1726 stop:1923 length:198 start_codon:yes stop_codon:yes gene_type:complete